jgi:hypothetical protein
LPHARPTEAGGTAGRKDEMARLWIAPSCVRFGYCGLLSLKLHNFGHKIKGRVFVLSLLKLRCDHGEPAPHRGLRGARRGPAAANRRSSLARRACPYRAAADGSWRVRDFRRACSGAGQVSGGTRAFASWFLSRRMFGIFSAFSNAFSSRPVFSLPEILPFRKLRSCATYKGSYNKYADNMRR